MIKFTPQSNSELNLTGQDALILCVVPLIVLRDPINDAAVVPLWCCRGAIMVTLRCDLG